MNLSKFLRASFVMLAVLLTIQTSFAQAVVGPVRPSSDQGIVLSAAVLSEATPVLGTPTELSLGSFRKHIVATAIQQRNAGELTDKDVRRIRVASIISRRWLYDAHQAAAESALAEGAATSYAAIDWSQLIDLLIKILPIILALFGI